jgi:hypothetical protein
VITALSVSSPGEFSNSVAGKMPSPVPDHLTAGSREKQVATRVDEIKVKR